MITMEKTKVSKLAKLNRGDVRRILRMWQDGKSSGGIREVFPQISQPTISAILARRVYRAFVDEYMQEQGLTALRQSNQQTAILAAMARRSVGNPVDFVSK